MEAELSQLRQDLRQHRVPTSEEMVEGMEQNTGSLWLSGEAAARAKTEKSQLLPRHGDLQNIETCTH